MIRVSDYWFGTEASLGHVLEAGILYQDNPALYPPGVAMRGPSDASSPAEGHDAADSLISVQDGIGFLSVSGPLTSQESWLDSLFGMTSYPVVARGVMKLAEMYDAGEISDIVHVFSTPGGDASGINGLTEVMQAAKEIAPNTVSFTGSHALSAGYWLASVNDRIYADKMAEVGSIGVISTVRSMHRALEADGIDVRVIRSGKYKALLHPYEPISEAGIKQVEEKGSQLHGFFVDHIQAARPGLRGGRAAWGEGQTFFGQEAVDIGLADEVMSLNTLVKRIQVRHNSAQSTYSFSNGSDSSTNRGIEMPKQVVFPTEADRALVAAGVPLAAVPHEEIDVEEPAAEQESQVAEPTTTGSTVTESPVTEVAASADIVSYLKAELKEARSEAEAFKAQLAHAEQERQQLASVEDALAPIAREAIQRLQVALRQTPMTLVGLPASVLAAQYNEVKQQFEKVMPVGVHALSASEASREPVDIGEQRLFLVK